MAIKQGDMDWRAVRNDYENATMTVRALCEQYGITKSSLYTRVKREGWARGGGNVKARGAASEKSTAAGPADPESRSTASKALIDRLYSMFDKQMADFEANRLLTAEEGVNEKDARMLGSLARTLEKLIELRESDDHNDETSENEVNIERLRDELARRIDRVRQKRGAE